MHGDIFRKFVAMSGIHMVELVPERVEEGLVLDLGEVIGVEVPDDAGELDRVHAPDVWVVGLGVVVKPKVDKRRVGRGHQHGVAQAVHSVFTLLPHDKLIGPHETIEGPQSHDIHVHVYTPHVAEGLEPEKISDVRDMPNFPLADLCK